MRVAFIDKQVFELEVSMYYIVFVQKGDGFLNVQVSVLYMLSEILTPELE